MSISLHKLERKFAKEQAEYKERKRRQKIEEWVLSPLDLICSCCGQNSDSYVSGKSNRFSGVKLTICVDCLFETCLQLKAKDQFSQHLKLLTTTTIVNHELKKN